MSIRSLVRPLLIPAALALATLTLAGPASAACTPTIPDSALIKKGTLIMSTNPTLPPLQYTDASGELKGMRVELGEEVAKRLCLTPEYVKIDFPAMVPGLQNGRWDVINTGIFVTDERTRIMNMIPYENQAISISAAASNPLKFEKIDDLAGRTVAVEIGGFEEKQARAMMADMTARNLKPFTLRTFDTFSIAYQALAAGQVEAVVSIDAVASEYQKRGFSRVMSGIHPTPVALATKNPQLANAIAGVLDQMQQDGTYQKLFAKYGIKPLEAPIAVAQPK
ncbi:ABC transporter substrate-binding protein [Paraburkholderia lacunae]|uniref:Amino acid ABC transporter n=1 Tax=Paraburkholderia lacunae TaxID=2211104 RepID=A0A370NBK4_9BURK|nr:ABC transporter substrate-binding protein [Paraburkholderia lacunae]RDK02984.1 amino acid ABC transporter [Paraburkholderia lacunae]